MQILAFERRTESEAATQLIFKPKVYMATAGKSELATLCWKSVAGGYGFKTVDSSQIHANFTTFA